MDSSCFYTCTRVHVYARLRRGRGSRNGLQSLDAVEK